MYAVPLWSKMPIHMSLTILSNCFICAQHLFRYGAPLICLNETVLRETQSQATVDAMQASLWWTAAQTTRLLLCHVLVYQDAALRDIIASNLRGLYQLVGVDLGGCRFMAFSKHFQRIYYGPRTGKKGAVELELGKPQENVSKLKWMSHEAAQKNFASNPADPAVTAEVNKVRHTFGYAVYHFVASQEQKTTPLVKQYAKLS